VLAATAVAGENPARAPAPRRIPVEQWVAQLGDPSIVAREAATRRLSALALDPTPELLAALTAPDPDTRARAAEAARDMRQNVAVSRLPRGQRFAEQGRIDLFVAATAVWDLQAKDQRLWIPAVDLGRQLIAKAELKGDRKPHNCPSSFRDFATYTRLLAPRYTRMTGPYLCPDAQQADPPALFYNEAIQAAGVVAPTGITNNLIVSRGSVQTDKCIHQSVVLANGDVRSVGGLCCVVVVCDGDVSVTDSGVTQSLIVARGNISIPGSASWSTLIAGGRVILGEQPNKRPARDPVVTENEPNALGYVTFFELSRVGLSATAVAGDVRVAAVAPGSACAAAGLRAGDVVLEVGGHRATDVEGVRRLLRDALALGTAPVKLKRGADTLTVTVALPE
jgi:hypothetical protein